MMIDHEELRKQIEDASKVFECCGGGHEVIYLLPCQIKALRERGWTTVSEDGHDEYAFGLKIREYREYLVI